MLSSLAMNRICHVRSLAYAQYTQIRLKIANLFAEVAPGGAIMNKAFVELLADTAALTYGLDSLPDMWLSISYTQVGDPK